MWWSIVLIIAGLALVVFAAEQLVKGAVGFARGIGASTFVVAVVFLGFDLENLAVGAVGSAQHSPGIAAATVVGSAMVAIALALGIAALVAPMRFQRVPRRVVLAPVAVTALLVALAIDGQLSRLDGGEVAGEVAKELPKAERLGPMKAGLLLAAALVTIVVASEMLVLGTRELLGRFGLSQTIIGMTVLALALSAEELAREVTPALRGHPEIAIGNVVGSVIAFFGLNAGVIALIQPLPIDTPTQRFYLPLAAATVTALAAMLLTRRLPRWAGATLLVIYAAFLTGGYLIYGTTAP